MLYNTAPANTLFAKVSVKTKPYSNEPVSIRIVADTYESAPVNKALFYTELPLQTVTLEAIQNAVAVFQSRANAKFAKTTFQKGKVAKVLAANALQ